MPETRKMHKSGVAVVLAVGIIATATLVPSAGGGEFGPSPFCLFCGQRALADFILNVVLFAPLGLALTARGMPLGRVLVITGGLSLFVELAQISIVAGRDSNITDLLANTAGGGAGWLALRGLKLARSTTGGIAPWLPTLAAAVPLGALLIGLVLMEPGLPVRPYYLQWTARFGNMQSYEGEVLTSRIGPLDLPGPPGLIGASDSVRVLLGSGAPVTARVRVAPPPTSIAPIVSIYDDTQTEVMLLGADRYTLVYRYRIRAQALRLDGADVRFPDLFRGVPPGDAVRLGVVGHGPGYCALVDEQTLCDAGSTVGRTFLMLYYRPPWDNALRRIVGFVWLAALFAPAGFIGGRWRHVAGAAAVAGPGLLAVPPLLGFAPTPLYEAIGALTGVGFGWLLSRLAR